MTYWGEYRSMHFSPLHQVEMSGQLRAPLALPPGKEPLYSLDGGLGGPQSRSGRVAKRKKIPTLLEIEPRSSSSI